MTRYLLIFLIVLSTSVLADEQVDTLKGPDNVFETKIKSDNGDTLDYGGLTSISVNAGPTPQVERILMSFANLADSVGAGQIITSAVASLYAWGATEGASISVYQMFRPWYEGSDSGAVANGVACGKGWYYVCGAGVDSTWSKFMVGDSSDAGVPNRGSGPNWVNSGTHAPTAASAADWANPTYVFSDWDQYFATIGGAAEDYYLYATDFDFAIPTTAIIDSIITTLTGKEVSAGGAVKVRLVKDGTTAVSTTWDQAVTTTNATYTDNEVPLWGITWTPAEINASTFGLRVEWTGSGTVVSVDGVAIWVVYHVGYDRAATAMSTVTVDSVGRFEWALDSAWINAIYKGTITTDMGMIFIGNTADSLTSFTSSEGTEAEWPLIIVTHEDTATTATGVPNVLHGPDGSGVLHSPEGGSVLHGP